MMDVQSWTLAAWSHALAAVAYALFTGVLLARGYLRGPREAAKLAMVVVCLACAAWAAMVWVAFVQDARIWRWGSQLMDVARYGAWFVFLFTLLRVRRPFSEHQGLGWLPAVATVLVVAALGAQLAQGWVRMDYAEGLRKVVLSTFMALPMMALVLLEQLFRNAAEDVRWSLKPLCLGLAGACFFDVYSFSEGVLFGRVDEDAFSIRGMVHALVVPFLLVAVSRRGDWLSRVHISRQAAFHSATLMLAGLYLLFISSVGYYVRYFGGEWGRALQMGMVFLGLVTLMVLMVSGSARASLRVFLGKHFFRYRYDYREEWLRFTRTLAGKTSPQEMGQQVVRGLANMLESPGGALWMKARGESAFRQTARWNMAHSEGSEPDDSDLVRFLQTSGWVVNLEEYRSYPRRYGGLQLPEWLKGVAHAWMIVPLMVADGMIGFVLLARARARVDVNWEVNDLLKAAGRQAASFLAQMQATEALLEVRKFDAFNRMSAFVVHDLKNIVTQLSLMMKNAQRLRNNPEFQEDMLLTVENSLDRMRQLMLQLREGATPPGTAVGVDLVAVAGRMRQLATERGRELELEIVDPVATRGHAERLERVIGHMVQNAFDATDPSGRVWLKLERSVGQASVEVGDTGRGMAPEFIRDRLFKPFQTTKQAGMGIGAYESYQYVQELGGKISVQSQVGQGTIVTVLLPLFDIQRRSDLQPLGAS